MSEQQLSELDVLQGHEFSSLNISGVSLAGKEFYRCKFQHCNMFQSELSKCSFENCEFKGCNLSVIGVKQTSFVDVSFYGCKCLGISWPNTRKPLQVRFDRCNLSQGTFLGLKLPGLLAVDCLLQEVDFSDADMRKAVFRGSDFSAARFFRTNLRGADFTGARNYFIDPSANELNKAVFSLPEALSFLEVLGVIVK